jgi:outer membrane protein assembly factor BamB
VIIANAGSSDHYMYALSASNGSVIWTFKTQGAIQLSSAAVSANAGILIVGSMDNNVYGLRLSDGVKLWNYTDAHPVNNVPVMVDSTVYVSFGLSNILRALNVYTGDVLWTFSAPPGSSLSGVAVSAGGTIYFGACNSLYALANTGGLLLNVTVGGCVGSPPIIGSDNIVYFGANDNRVYAMHGISGVILWSYTTAGPVFATPVIGVDGWLYVTSNDRWVYALATPPSPTPRHVHHTVSLYHQL